MRREQDTAKEKKREERLGKRFLFLLFLLLLAGIMFLLGICIGSVRLSPEMVLRVLGGKTADPEISHIILKIRLPRVLAAFWLGGALGLSGYLLQTFFRNPIAGPYVLGISSGARLIVALVLIDAARRAVVTGSFLLIFAAFIGALLSMGFVLLFSLKIQRMSQLIVAGIMIGYICSAITDFVVTFAEDADIISLHNWSRGSLSGMSGADVRVMSILVSICLLGCILLAKPIMAYQAGEDYARTLGVHLKAVRILIILISSMLSACVTAFAGPVSFVGIAVPQIIRGLGKCEQPIWMIPGCFLGGGIFCIFCDMIARSILAPSELSISTVTAVFGAPVVIILLLRRHISTV